MVLQPGVYLRVSFTCVKINLKKVKCTSKVHLKTVIISASGFVRRLVNRMAGVAEGNFSWLALLG